MLYEPGDGKQFDSVLSNQIQHRFFDYKDNDVSIWQKTCVSHKAIKTIIEGH